jgi:adenylosuccinate synthase
VGGPFPTELDWETPGTPGYHMSTVGAEKGVTTGRSRRCGWFDAALLKRSAQVNGLSGLCITKLDVLDGLKELQAVHRLRCWMVNTSTSCPWVPTTSLAASRSTRPCRAGARAPSG